MASDPARATPERAAWSSAGVVARLDALVAEHDAGDVARACARFGVAPDALGRLAAALADDAGAGRGATTTAAAVLAGAARAYGVDAIWLVTGVEDFRGERLPPDARLRVAELLLAVGRQLLGARRGAVPPLSATPYDSRHDDDPPP